MGTSERLYIFCLRNGYRAVSEGKDFDEVIQKARKWHGEENVVWVEHFISKIKKNLIKE